MFDFDLLYLSQKIFLNILNQEEKTCIEELSF